MALKTNVLVENISNLSEARYCSGMGVQFLACPTNQVNPQLFAAIRGWVQGPKMIIDIRETDSQLNDVNEYEADFILLKTAQLQIIVQQVTVPFFVQLDLGNEAELGLLSDYANRIEFVVVHQVSDPIVEKLLALNYSVLARVGENGIHTLNPQLHASISGIVLSGEAEDSPGLKNYDHLSSVFEELEVEDN